MAVSAVDPAVNPVVDRSATPGARTAPGYRSAPLRPALRRRDLAEPGAAYDPRRSSSLFGMDSLKALSSIAEWDPTPEEEADLRDACCAPASSAGDVATQ